MAVLQGRRKKKKTEILPNNGVRACVSSKVIDASYVVLISHAGLEA